MKMPPEFDQALFDALYTKCVTTPTRVVLADVEPLMAHLRDVLYRCPDIIFKGVTCNVTYAENLPLYRRASIDTDAFEMTACAEKGKLSFNIMDGQVMLEIKSILSADGRTYEHTVRLDHDDLGNDVDPAERNAVYLDKTSYVLVRSTLISPQPVRRMASRQFQPRLLHTVTKNGLIFHGDYEQPTPTLGWYYQKARNLYYVIGMGCMNQWTLHQRLVEKDDPNQAAAILMLEQRLRGEYPELTAGSIKVDNVLNIK